MQKLSTKRVTGKRILKGHQLTIGIDLGDRWSFYCVLNELGEVLQEEKLPTTPDAMKRTFEKLPASRIVLETGTHSPWISRLLAELEARSDRGPCTESAVDHQEQSKR